MGLIAYVFQLWVWGERVEERGLIRWFWWGVALCVGWNMCGIWMSGNWPWSVGVGGVSGVTLDVAGGLLEKENEMGRMALNKLLIKSDIGIFTADVLHNILYTIIFLEKYKNLEIPYFFQNNKYLNKEILLNHSVRSRLVLCFLSDCEVGVSPCPEKLNTSYFLFI
jgi:hypothetical protein